MSSTAPTYLHAIGTAVPAFRYEQDFALARSIELMGDSQVKRNFLERIYRHSAIRSRYFVIGDYARSPAEHEFFPKNAELKPEPSTAVRNSLYQREANALSLAACRDLLRQLDPAVGRSISHIVTASCTGVGAPGIDLYLRSELDLAPTVQRYHVGFMGCYAALPALRLAATIARDDSDARVLVVCCEICSIHFQQKWDREIQVANALFADGAAAALVSRNRTDTQGAPFRLDSFQTDVIGDSAADMTWTIGETGFDMRLSTYIPRLVGGAIGPALAALFARAGVRQEQIDQWAIHPGGKAILDRIEDALALPPAALDTSRAVLRDYGNMSSATALFVLARMLADSRYGRTLTAAFGPGLTLEAALLDRTAPE